MPQPTATPITGSNLGKHPRPDSLEAIILNLQQRVAALEAEISRLQAVKI